MQRRLNLLYLSIILLPVAALAFFGIRAAAGEQNRLRRAQERLWRSELETLEGDMFLELEGMEESLQNLVIGSPSDIEGLRELNRNLSWVRQIFIISPDGEFLFPPRESAGMMEENFFLRTAPLWQGGISFHQVIEGEDSTSADSGWRPYYEGMNVSFLYWMKRDDGTIVGFDIYREQILSQLLLFLSDPDLMDQDPQDYKLFMRDEKGALTSISGQYSAYEDQRSLLTYHLREPPSRPA